MKKLLLSTLLCALLPLSQAQQSEQDKVAEENLDGIAEVLLADNEELQAEFAKMQADLPKTLELAKEYRACLQDADDKEEATDCGKDAQAKAKKMGIEDDELDEDLDSDFKSWTAEDKARELKEMDESIAMMEKVMPCMLEAKNPLELMVCGQVLQEQSQEQTQEK